MIWRERPFTDTHASRYEQQGLLRIVEMIAQQPGEVVEARCDLWMVFAEGFLPNFERAFVQRLGLVVLSLWNAVSAISELNNPPGLSTPRRGR